MIDNVDYERIRLENIKRNEEFLASLGLDSTRDALSIPTSTRAQPSRRGTSTSSMTSTKMIPTRRSGRVTIERLRIELEELKQSKASSDLIDAKEQELTNMIAKKDEGSYDVNMNTITSTEQQSRRLSPEPISLYQPKNMEESDETKTIVLDNLIKPCEGIHRSYQSSSRQTIRNDESLTEYKSRLNKLRLNENDIAKLTESRITSVFCHPSNDRVLVAAGDKDGNLGLWNVDDLNGTHGGVYHYKPHTETIIKLYTDNKRSELLRTVSYDGTLRALDLHQSAFIHEFEAPESIDEMIFTDASNHDDTVLVSRSDGYVSLIDFRQSNRSYGWKASISDSKINSVQIAPSNSNILLTSISRKDGHIMMHDMRKISTGSSRSNKPLIVIDEHKLSINAAYLSHDGQWLVSISQDNTIRVWNHPIESMQSSKPMESSFIRHDNHTGRWLSTFRHSFDPKQSNAFVTGSMDRPRRIEVFGLDKDASKKNTKGSQVISLLNNLQGDYFGSVCSRCCFHESLDIIIGGNSSGRVHVFR